MLVQLAQLEGLVRHGTAGDADDELEHEGGDGIARVTGQNVGQRQTDGTGQTAGHTVQQQSGQGGEGVAQMERGAAVERDAEEQRRHKAQRGHDAGERQLLGGEGALVQHTDKYDGDDYDCQQQPHCGSRHDDFPSRFPELEIPTKLLDIWAFSRYAPIICGTDTMKIPRIKFFYGVSLMQYPNRRGVLWSI